MADTEEGKKKTEEEPKAEKRAEKESSKIADMLSGGMLQWIIMAVVILLFAAIGFVVGKLVAVPGPEVANAMQTDPNQTQQQPNTAENTQKGDDDSEINLGAKTWFYPLESVTANPDEPGAMRFIRATLTLELSSELSSEEDSFIIEEKKPVLVDWLTIYLSSLTIEDASGGKNKKRIQAQILDAFNETLFPDSKPKIKKILLTEFAIQ